MLVPGLNIVPKKSILMIAYYFPPCGGSGVLRIVRFARNLFDMGWRPLVLTVDEKDIGKLAYGTMSFDHSYSKVAGGIRTVRTRLVRPSYIAFRVAKFLLAVARGAGVVFMKLLRKLPAAAGGKGTAVENRAGGHPAAGGPGRRAKRDVRTYHSSDISPLTKFIFDSILISDQLLEWPPTAVLGTLLRIARSEVDYIFSSSPPWNVHLIAFILKYLYRKKWVMDLRDPIFDIATEESPAGSSSKVVRLFYQFLESFLVSGADVIICNCDEIMSYYRGRYKKKRFEVITNAFDPGEFAGPPAGRREESSIVFSYVGAMYPTIRTPDVFLEAIAAVLGERPELAERIRINFVGESHYIRSSKFRDIVEGLGLESLINCSGYVPHDEAVAEMMNADVLLLLQPHRSTYYQVPAKLYEYIATGKPVMAIAPRGSATYNIIERYGLGMVNDPEDIAGIKENVQSVIDGRARVPAREVVNLFSAGEVTKKLAGIFQSLERSN